MQNFSEINKMPNKQQLIEFVFADTGLPKKRIEQIYEAQQKFGKTQTEILNYFNNLSILPIESSSDSFLKHLNKLVPNVDKNNYNEAFILLMDNYANNESNSTDNVKNLDSINLLTTIQKILTIKNKSIIDEILSKTKFNLINDDISKFEKQIPSLTEALKEQTPGQTLELYESLRLLLMKNNKRWGYSTPLKNVYQTMVDYLDNETSKIQKEKLIYTVDTDNSLMIIKNILSSNPSPEYKHINYVKTLVADLETFAFDLFLIINSYFVRNKKYVEYIGMQKSKEFSDISIELFLRLQSAHKNSKVIDINKYNEVFLGGNGDFQLSLDTELLTVINHKLINIDNVTGYNILFAINLLSSMSTEFNLSYRMIFKKYVTIASNYINVLEQKKLQLAKATNNL